MKFVEVNGAFESPMRRPRVAFVPLYRLMQAFVTKRFSSNAVLYVTLTRCVFSRERLITIDSSPCKRRVCAIQWYSSAASTTPHDSEYSTTPQNFHSYRSKRCTPWSRLSCSFSRHYLYAIISLAYANVYATSGYVRVCPHT